MPGRTQAILAGALGVTQQTVSALVAKKPRPLSVELAKLIQEATGIAWDGWFTATELENWGKRTERARKLRSMCSAA